MRQISSRDGVDVGSVLLGLGAAVVLVGVSSASGSSVSLIAAAAVTAYALLVPLRPMSLLKSGALTTVVSRLSIVAFVAVAAGALSGVAVNSHIEPIAILGNVAMVCTLGGLMGFALWKGLSMAKRAGSVLCPAVVGAFGELRTRASVVMELSLTRPERQ